MCIHVMRYRPRSFERPREAAYEWRLTRGRKVHDVAHPIDLRRDPPPHSNFGFSSRVTCKLDSSTSTPGADARRWQLLSKTKAPYKKYLSIGTSRRAVLRLSGVRYGPRRMTNFSGLDSIRSTKNDRIEVRPELNNREYLYHCHRR